MNKIKITVLFLFALSFVSCGLNEQREGTYDGRLDVRKIRIAAKTAGTVDSLFADEGDVVRAGQLLAVLETDQLRLQLKSKQAQQEELEQNMKAMSAQLNELDAQLRLAKSTFTKTQALLKKGAATDQKRDELQTQVLTLQAKREALFAQQRALEARKKQLTAAIDLTKLSLRDARITAPQNGVIINRFINRHELAAPGTVLFELGDLSVMDATIYVPLTDLDNIRIGQSATLTIDGSDQKFPGKVKWISSEAEFTPKTILTKETRTTLVYAVKITVPNPDNILKIGMPVQVQLKH